MTDTKDIKEMWKERFADLLNRPVPICRFQPQTSNWEVLDISTDAPSKFIEPSEYLRTTKLLVQIKSLLRWLYMVVRACPQEATDPHGKEIGKGRSTRGLGEK